MTALPSSTTFYVGELLHLRADLGGGTWRVVEVLPHVDGFAKALAVRVDHCPACDGPARARMRASRVHRVWSVTLYLGTSEQVPMIRNTNIK